MEERCREPREERSEHVRGIRRDISRHGIDRRDSNRDPTDHEEESLSGHLRRPDRIYHERHSERENRSQEIDKERAQPDISFLTTSSIEL